MGDSHFYSTLSADGVKGQANACESVCGLIDVAADGVRIGGCCSHNYFPACRVSLQREESADSRGVGRGHIDYPLGGLGEGKDDGTVSAYGGQRQGESS